MNTERRRKITTMEVMVAETIVETPETTTLVLFTGNDHLDYLPGHFLTIDPHQFEALERWVAYLEDLKGKPELPRAYSIASAPDEPYLAITIKEERYITGVTKYPPLLSPILTKRTTAGRKMVVTGFTGPYTLPADDKIPENILHICAGSGVVPNYSIIKYTLRNYENIKHTLIYSNKTWEDTIYARQFLKLHEEYPDRLKIVFSITREPAPKHIEGIFVQGRVNRALIEFELMQLDDPLIFVCGPAISKYDKIRARETGEQPRPRFMESVLGSLQELGVDKKRIKREIYG